MVKHAKSFWKYFSDNTTKGIITTILGIFIVLGSVISVFLGKADWTQACFGIGAGIAAIGFMGKRAKLPETKGE
ncbi:hypothetical protein CH379_018555 [Leptospira ellisii]|uniref:Uncharacterized protein n=1 Tax=Leptospira ellisii TaxID=2023197 RepID=A0AAE4QR16_9LEPT|nr:hypothetical protein [Leptospira ellisii]MDV6237639.1 hypothetical protein [Leptospira ellisii]PKA02456.1 hypothetical protein CH375_22980 [Leptospira ellisii]